jgi:hypothetical protein
MEEFRTVEHFPKYEISNTGILRNKKTRKILLPRLNKDGYVRINLYNDGVSKTCFIHRLVAIAFIENPMNQQIVDHIDRNKINNHTSNLRWCNISQNTINSKLYNTNTSLHKGVSYCTSREKYQVHMSINNKTTFCGYFDNLEDAVKHRKNLEEIHYGEFNPL